MNRASLLTDIDTVKDQARAETQIDRLDQAERILTKLIQDIHAFLGKDPSYRRGESESFGRAYSNPLTKKLVEHLADAYGMLGGVRWRRANLQGAIDSYRLGSRYERDEKFDISNSYNMTNLIVLEIIVAPAGLEAKRDEIHEVHELVRRQVDGPRGNQWWAWADYALLSVFVGDETEMLRGYGKFKDCGPRARDCRSVLRVLDACKDGVGEVNKPVARLLDEAIGEVTSVLDDIVALEGEHIVTGKQDAPSSEPTSE